MGSAMPPSKGDGPPHPENFWDTHVCGNTLTIKRPNLAMITYVGRTVFLWVNHAFPSQGTGPSPEISFRLLPTSIHSTATKFCNVTRGDRASRGQLRTPNCVTSYMSAHSIRNINQIFVWWLNWMWGNFYMVDHTTCLRQHFWWHECWRAICLR